jgi:hypothetical protein
MSNTPGHNVGDLVAALEGAGSNGDACITPRSQPDPATIAAINARARERYAHHKAGYLVAVFVRGGRLTEVGLASVDCYLNADSLGGPQHQCAVSHQPFRTYAAMWSQAKWEVEHGGDFDSFADAFESAVSDALDGCAYNYGEHVDVLDGIAAQLGFSRVGISCPWEDTWYDESERLWDAIREIARQLVNGCWVAHADVKAAVEIRCPQC